MTTEGRKNLKDNLSIVATALNILLSLGVILGGMNWISQVNVNLEKLTTAISGLDSRLANAEAELRHIDRRHVAEDALCKTAIKGVGVH